MVAPRRCRHADEVRRPGYPTRMLAVITPAIVALGLAACAPSARAPSITVFAAVSLKAAFTEIAGRFNADNPGVAVDFNFAGSADLATQLGQGATADVFASANAAQMDKVAGSGLLAGKPVPFASNTLVIVTAPGNPKKVGSFADLGRPGLVVVACQEPVPCGAAARQIEERTTVRINPVSEEPDVADVLSKVTGGQADAGLVYLTDALSAGDRVTCVEFPEAADAVNIYPIAVLKDASQSELAHKFVDLVTGEAGQKILHAAGFAKP